MTQLTRKYLRDPQGFAALPPQFILWKSVPDMPPKKPRKVPCDAKGVSSDPHDQLQFMDYDTAVSVAAEGGFNVGFVLTEDDDYFLLDLDDVRNPENGQYDNWSHQIVANFPGAAMEVSYSGTGMHIYGKCDAERLRVLRRKFADNKGEFYTEGRFVALGHDLMNPQGFDLDWTEQLEGLIPKRDVTEMEADTSGPVPEYTGGSWTDDELIDKMLDSGGSMAAQFGDKIHPRDLWTCDVSKLAAHFPSQSGDEFDRSSADASLMSHLAFWSGKDCQRMDKLFRMSGLMRDKYDKRPDYRQNTLMRAIAGCRAVYGVAGKAEPISDYILNENGLPYKNMLHNMECSVRLTGVTCRKNDLTGRYELFGVDGMPDGEMSDERIRRVWMTTEKQTALVVSQTNIIEILSDQGERDSYNPLVERLDSFKWDGFSRLNDWLTAYLCVEPTPFTRAVGRIMLIGAVRRAKHPGCKLDEMIVLEGPQGGGKSTAVKILALEKAWFTDEIDFAANTKEIVEQIGGKWFVEVGELSGMSGRDVARVKSVLSRQEDRARAAYGRFATDTPRSQVFFGTYNPEGDDGSAQYLRDRSGNRRFYPIRVGKVDLDGLRGDVEQLWAEAVALEAAGESHSLDPSLYEAQRAETAARMVENPYVEKLEHLFADMEGRFPVAEVPMVLGVNNPNSYAQRDITQAMAQIGFEKRGVRYLGKKTKCFTRGRHGDATLTFTRLSNGSFRIDKVADIEMGVQGGVQGATG